MAIRIPVVISQHERRAGSIADYEEQLITRLVMENGLDATLIADLKSIELDTTDHLCIEGLKGDFALATWENAQYVCDHLHRLGISTLEIIPVDGSQKSQSGDVTLPAKKIFMISLATNMPIDTTIASLKDLLVSRSTPVFSIGTPVPRIQPATILPAPTLNVFPTSTRIDAAVPISPKEIAAEMDFPNIDQLMEELDQFQI